MRNLAFAASLAFAAVALAPRPATAQAVSDADRQAARELYGAGFQLQQAGHYAEALQKFQKAQDVFSAPTNLLHIAECEAQLGKLVEAAETYRGLVHLQLPKDAPQSFIAAQSQGAAELQQVEARIPKVRIDIVPANVPNLSITIDDQPMNTALVGVDRPIDPGPHKIVIFAPGYGRQEQAITVREKEPPKPVTITLQGTSGVIYGPAVVPSSGVGTLPPQGGAGTFTPPPAGGATPSPDQPPPYDGKTPPSGPPPERHSKSSLLLGARLGASIPGGQLSGGKYSNQDDDKLSTAMTSGVAIGLQAGLRFARRGYIGALYEYGGYGRGDKAGAGFGDASPSSPPSTGLVALELAYISNADSVGVLLGLGLGYRWAKFYTQPSGGQEVTATYSAGELLLSGGIFIKAGDSVRIVPRIDVGLGSFTNVSVDCGSSVAGVSTCPSGASGSTSVPATAGHSFIFLGVGGYFNLDLDKK